MPLRAHRLFVSVSAYPCRWPRIPRQLSTAHPAQNAGGSIDVQNFRFTCVLLRKRSQNAKQGLMEWVGQRIIHDWDCIPISIPKARRAGDTHLPILLDCCLLVYTYRRQLVLASNGRAVASQIMDVTGPRSVSSRETVLLRPQDHALLKLGFEANACLIYELSDRLNVKL